MRGEDEMHEVTLLLEKERYNGLVEMCRKYREQQGKEITPKEYILMLIDSALGNKVS